MVKNKPSSRALRPSASSTSSIITSPSPPPPMPPTQGQQPAPAAASLPHAAVYPTTIELPRRPAPHAQSRPKDRAQQQQQQQQQHDYYPPTTTTTMQNHVFATPTTTTMMPPDVFYGDYIARMTAGAAASSQDALAQGVLDVPNVPSYSEQVSLGDANQLQQSMREMYARRVRWHAEHEQQRSRHMVDPLREEYRLKQLEEYTQPFCTFLTENPTIWHATQYFQNQLDKAGFKQLSPRKSWHGELKAGGKYYHTRNGNALIAFTIGDKYESGNGVAMIAGHIDALTARLKPISKKPNVAGYVQLGVAPYAGGMGPTWWDRDLGIAGRVLVQDRHTGKVTTKLVNLDWPVAKISTLAPHFGLPMMGSGNQETEMVPIIGLDAHGMEAIGDKGSFTSTQPPRLVQLIAKQLGVTDYATIINWELELYNYEPARTIGLDHELISGSRIDDKLCSWSAMEALLSSATAATTDDDTSSGIIKLVALFDNEEIGSGTRQGAKSDLLPGTIERIVEVFATSAGHSMNALHATYANSLLLSADVVHAAHPNFLAVYEHDHAPRLNTGLVIHANSQGHVTTDSVSTSILEQITQRANIRRHASNAPSSEHGALIPPSTRTLPPMRLQYFIVRNDTRSGGTVGPILSTSMGCRAIDVGAPMLGMHSIRSTTGARDPGLGVHIYRAFLDEFEDVDREFGA